jgi:predicted ATPase
VVLILEDLQRAGSESIVMLERLNQIVAQLPVFIVGNYRDDERLDLPREVPTMQVIKLNRLTEVESLCSANR